MRTKSILTLEDVRKISAAAEAEAIKNNWNVAIAILDDGGHLLGFTRMDGATAANAKIAMEKAYTSAFSRRATKVWEERITSGRLSTLSMPVLSVQGGLPIMVSG